MARACGLNKSRIDQILAASVQELPAAGPEPPARGQVRAARRVRDRWRAEVDGLVRDT
jgi:hypothetical protein